MGLPAGVIPGQIYRHSRFYRNSAGLWQTKYLLVLAGTPGDDVIFRLLTSRAHGRPESPHCYHGDPYPGFYLGVLGEPLTTKSWLDLRGQDDYEGSVFAIDCTRGILQSVGLLPLAVLCQAMNCTANADDTTTQQERLLRDQRARLYCP